MRWPAIQSLYEELTKDSLENAVDVLWNNILHLYFKVENNYAIVFQANPDRKSKTNADFAIRSVHNGELRKVILIEEKHEEGSDAAWTGALEQLLESMLQARVANASKTSPIYGIITVGHYSRFYTLSPGASTFINFSSNDMDYKGDPLHFNNDECSMHTLLEELVRLTS